MWAPAHMSPDLHPFWILDWAEVLAPEVIPCSVVLFLSGVLCSAAGIGGGGVYVAVLMVTGQLSPHNAVPLSKAVVFFGAMATLALNFKREKDKHGSAQEAVIDYHTVRITVPAALLGTYLGVALNLHTNGHTIVILLAALLSLMTFTVSRTAWEQYCQEQSGETASINTAAPRNIERGVDSETGEDTPLLSPWLPKNSRANLFTSTDVAVTGSLLCAVIVSGVLRFHMRACRQEAVGHGTTGACVHPVMHIFGTRMQVWMGDPTTAWVLQNSIVAVSLAFCLFVATFYSKYTYQTAGWTLKQIACYQAMGVATGLLAGLVGVGGGLIFSPFFLIMGMEPAVAVATSSTCVLFTSSSTTLQYVFTDRVVMSLALVYGLVTLVASYAGTSLVHCLQDNFKGRRSLISFIVAIAVALSAVLALVKFFRMMSGIQVA